MESWRKVWRQGVAPLLSTEGLEALRRALLGDDPRLIQGATTQPPPLVCWEDWDCEGACALSYTGWQGDGLTTVGECEEYFARLAWEVDKVMGEPCSVRWFLEWYDEGSRQDVFGQLLTEVTLALKDR